MKKFMWTLSLILVSGAATGAVAAWYFQGQQNRIEAEILAYLDETRRIERAFVENLPLYSDWSSAAKERRLRRYLLKFHLDLARKSGLPRVQDDADMARHIQSGVLAPIERGPEALFYFYNLKQQYRVLSPETTAGLKLLTERLQNKIRERAPEAPPVKIAVSSALRPVAYQASLRGRNANAAYASSHSYGVSFDIFYDDYYVVLPPITDGHPITRAVLSKLRSRMGFLLGDALSGQFRTVLMETLIELQDEGKLYAILERNQRCYHVSILPAGYVPPTEEE